MKKLIFAALAITLCMAAAAQTDQTPAAQGAPAADERQQAIRDSLYLDSLQNVDMDEVTVTSQRQLVKNDIDKLTYDVQADKDSKTKTLMEMLRKVPMVTVDGQDNVKIKGSSSYKIYRNGHRDPSFEGQNLATILKSMPANTIKKIEVITDPGAKEDAEGTAYILNIVMLDNARFGGVAGSVTSGYDFLSKMNFDNLWLTSKFGKLTLTANYTFVVVTEGSQNNASLSDYLYKNGQRMQTSSTQDHLHGFFHMGDLSASYELDSLNLITLSAGVQAFGPSGMDQWCFGGSTSLTDAGGQTVYAYDTDARLKEFDQYNVHGRLDYQHKTRLDGEALTLSYMFAANGNATDQTSTFLNMQGAGVGYDAYNSYSKTRFTEHTAQIDYIRPIGQYNKFEVGGKYIDRSSTSNTRMEYAGAEENNLDNRFKNTTRIGAAYVEWIYNRNKWSARAGLRYEFSRLEAKYLKGDGTDFHRNLNDWVPSASIKYDLNDNNSFKLSLSTSISRPGIGYLNPTRVETPTTISYGNASLNSTHTTYVTLDYTHIGTKLTWNLSPYVGWMRNALGTVQFLEGSKQVSTYDGVKHDVTWGMTGYAQWTPWSGTQLSYNGGVYYNRHSNHSLGLALGAWGSWHSVELSQKLPWKLQLSMGGGGNIGRSVANLYGYGSSWYDYYLSLQRSFFKDDRLTVQLSANNPIGPRHINYDSHVVQGDYTGLDRWTQADSKQVSLRISWRFGRLKASVKSVDKSIENNDLKSGGGGGISIGGK